MNNLVIQKMIGGLGNQMFQYAFIKALSLRSNTDFKLDLSPFKYYKTWPYELENLNIEKKYAKINEIPFYLRVNPKNKYLAYVNNVYIRPLCFKLNKNHFKEREGVFEKGFLNKKKGYFDGYFQDIEYFKDLESEIRKDFTFSKPLSNKNLKLLESLDGKETVCIHVRRGDYLKFPEFHPICSIQYYNQAIGYIKDKINNPTFLFFSDDSNWTKQNFNGENYIFIDRNKGGNSRQDMALMSKCKHNIIANSSFSWWGAFLNNNPNKIIIAPKLRTNKNTYNSHCAPTNWILF